MDNTPRVSVDVEAYRVAAGISVNDLAERTTIPRTTLRRCLADPSRFTLGDYVRVASILDIPADLEVA